MATFIDVQVDPCAAAADGIGLRFKGAGEARPVPVHEVPYESEEGLAGRWRVYAVAVDDSPGEAAVAVPVEDSSDGTAWLIVGGAGGLRLEHTETGAIAREPYLVLAIQTELR